MSKRLRKKQKTEVEIVNDLRAILDLQNRGITNEDATVVTLLNYMKLNTVKVEAETQK